MPTRLLEVRSMEDGTIDACIISTDHTGKVPYLILSYCWGGDQSTKTTEQSLRASRGKVDVSKSASYNHGRYRCDYQDGLQLPMGR